MIFEYLDTKETFTLEDIFKKDFEIIEELKQQKQKIIFDMSINNYNIENSIRAYSLIEKIDNAIKETEEDMKSFEKNSLEILMTQMGGVK